MDDFIDKVDFGEQQVTSDAKVDKYVLKDEDSDEERSCEDGYMWVNINDLM